MLTQWLVIDATRSGEITIVFLGGFNLVVYDGFAELAHGARLIALLTVATA